MPTDQNAAQGIPSTSNTSGFVPVGKGILPAGATIGHRIHLVWLGGAGIAHRVSNDGGDSFSAEQVIASGPSIKHFNVRPSVVADDSVVSVGWAEAASEGLQFRMRESRDAGASWGEIRTIGAGRSLSLLKGSPGSLHAIVSDSDAVHCRTTKDGGDSWSEPQRVFSLPSSTLEVAATVVADKIHVLVWAMDNQGSEQCVWHVAANVDCRGWAAPVAVAPAHKFPAGMADIGESHPALHGSKEGLMALWSDPPEPDAPLARQTLKVSRSLDSGATWLPAQPLNPVPEHPARLTAKAVGTNSRNVYITSNLGSFISRDNAATWSEPDSTLLGEFVLITGNSAVIVASVSAPGANIVGYRKVK